MQQIIHKLVVHNLNQHKFKKMTNTILTLILAFAVTTICNAQKIEIKKVFGGHQYTQNENRMTMGALVKAMESNSDALEFMKKAKSNNVFASILGGVGGALIGFPIGTAIGGGDANWTLAGIGAGLVAIGIPISSGVHKNTKKAIDLYNSSLNSVSHSEFKPDFKIVANGNGIGLSMNF
jgi:outer membrane lipoprotein SlyB